jgi:predicted DNA-binding transcriptional regulator
MPDGSRDAHIPLSDEALDEAERRALIAAVAEALADPRPDIPHEEVRAEIMADIEALERQIAASLAA